MPQYKIYKKENSPLYGLSNKRKLAELLKVDHLILAKLTSDDFYKVNKIITGEKVREIQTPYGELRKVHTNLFKLIRKIETPEYLFSGKKGLSYIDNAFYHKDNHYIVAMDIEKFYQNSRSEFVFRFFHHTMKMSADISYLLKGIVCYNNFIPTGSSLSQTLAYWAYSNVFNEINKIASESGVKFSLYVDDMTFSSKEKIISDFHLLIDAKLKKVGLHIKRKKLKYYSKNHCKIITGCTITPEHYIKVPNYIRKNIIDKLESFSEKSSLSEVEYSSLLGSIVSAQQIESDIFKQTRRYLKINKSKILTK
jgi:hypothetical protein